MTSEMAGDPEVIHYPMKFIDRIMCVVADILSLNCFDTMEKKKTKVMIKD